MKLSGEISEANGTVEGKFQHGDSVHFEVGLGPWDPGWDPWDPGWDLGTLVGTLGPESDVCCTWMSRWKLGSMVRINGL